MASITREKLLAAKLDLPSEQVDVPKLGKVTVRGMTGKEQAAFYKSVTKRIGNKVEVDEETFNARLVAKCLVDDKGERLLRDDEFTLVQSWPGSVFNILSQAAMRVNGINTDAGN